GHEIGNRGDSIFLRDLGQSRCVGQRGSVAYQAKKRPRRVSAVAEVRERQATGPDLAFRAREFSTARRGQVGCRRQSAGRRGLAGIVAESSSILRSVTREERVDIVQCDVTVSWVVSNRTEVPVAEDSVTDAVEPVEFSGRVLHGFGFLRGSDRPIARAVSIAAGASARLPCQRVVGANAGLLAQAENRTRASAGINCWTAEYGGFGDVALPRDGLILKNIDSCSRQTEGAGIAVGAGEDLLQLSRGGIFQVRELAHIPLDDEDERGRSYIDHGVFRNGRAADGVLAADVERQDISLIGAAGVAALDGRSHVSAGG